MYASAHFSCAFQKKAVILQQFSAWQKAAKSFPKT